MQSEMKHDSRSLCSFKNAQWAVTGYGVEVLPPEPEYFIEADRLAERTIDGRLLNWPLHMARKEWVEIELFLTAFKTALDIHMEKYGAPIVPELIEKSFQHARAVAFDLHTRRERHALNSREWQ
jgi:hypothetical protein